MTLDELESFVHIATGIGFTHAARALHRSQPAISRRIRQLEQSLDAELFERVGRSARLTESGRALLPHAEAVLAAARDAERAVRDAARVTRGRARTHAALRVAIVGTLADTRLVAALRAFRKRFGDSSVELRTATSREVSVLVRRGEADLGLRYHADPDPRLESLELARERLRVVVPANHRIRARRVPELRAFAADAWLTFPPDPRQPETVGSLERRLLAAGIAQPKVGFVDSLTAQKRLVEAGLGVALLPESSFREEVRLGTLRTVEVADLSAEQPIVLVRRRSAAKNPQASALVELLRSRAPRLLGRKRPSPVTSTRRRRS
jgi:DNA-binding transcriptional LysR family regulator